MKEIDKLLKEQEQAADYQVLMGGLKELPTADVDEAFYKGVLSQIGHGAETTAQRYLLFFGGSVVAFLILGFAGLIYSLGWEGIVQMQQTLLYGLFIAAIIFVFQVADHLIVKPKLRLT